MVMFENDENEKLAQADRLFRKKVTAVGALADILEEPFFDFRTLPETQIMNKQPTADTDFAAPDYDEYPVQEGAVGTRFGVTASGDLDPVRLHSYLPSGFSGPESCQTFFVIKPFESPPSSHDIFELENKRMYPIIGPEFSPRRQSAAESDPTKRGFHLALYPAKSDGGVGSPLVADDAYGPIPMSADPGAVRGADDGGYWYVDYDNGVVRLSRPMLHGPDGVFNPNNVYADIDGNEVEEEEGAPTLFAVFYRYTGDFGIDNRTFITVGDGYVSEGLFNGVSANTLQSAINSLPDVGGTIFIKEGTYDYIEPVRIRGGIRIIGLSGVKITRPRTEPAFTINEETRGVVDGYQTLEGIEIYPRDGVNSGGAIELRSSASNQEIRRVQIRNNLIFAENDAPAITFGPEDDCTYFGLKVQDNIFKRASSNPVYISYRDRGGEVEAPAMQLINNDFQLGDSAASTAILFDGTVVTDIDGIVIDNNNMESSDINLSIGASSVDGFTLTDTKINNITLGDDADSIVMTNNIISGTASFQDISNSTLSNNHTGALSFVDLSDSQFTNNNTDALSGDDISGSTFSNNNTGAVTLTGSVSNSNVNANNMSGAFSCVGISDTAMNSNNVTGSITLSGALTDSKLSANNLAGSLTAASNNSSVVSDNIVGVDIDIGASDTLRLLRNEVGDDVVLSTVLDSVLESNIVTDDFTGTTLTTSKLLNNSVGDNLTFTTLSAVTLDGNNCSDLSLGAVSGSNINANNVTGTFTLTSTIANSNLNDNIGGAVLSISSTLSGVNANNNHFASAGIGAMSSSFFENNILDSGGLSIGGGTGTLTSSYLVANNISGSIVAGDLTSSAVTANNTTTMTLGDLQSSVFNNNIGTSFAVGAVDDSVVDKNIGSGTFTAGAIDTSKFTDNTFTGADLNGTVSNSTISGNDLGNAIGGDSIDIAGSFNDSVLTNNNMSGNLDISTSTSDSIFAANKVAGMDFVSLTDSIVTANEISGTLSSTGGTSGALISENRLTSGGATHNLGAVSDAIINDNLVTNNLTISSLSSAIFSGNDIGGTFTSSGALTSTTFDGNKMNDGSIAGMTDSFFTDNAITASDLTITSDISGSFITGNGIAGGGNFNANVDFTTSVFSGNAFEDVLFGEIGDRTVADQGCLLDDNIMTDFTVTEGITDSVISNSIINGNTLWNNGAAATSTLLRSTFSGNILKGTFDCGQARFFDSVISDNYFDDTVTFRAIEDCVVSDNTMTASTAINITDANSSTEVITSSSVTGNVFAALDIENDQTSGTATGGIGSSIFSNNRATSLTFDTRPPIGTGTATTIADSIITDNEIHGAFTIVGNSNAEAIVRSDISHNVIKNATFSIDNEAPGINPGDVVIASEISHNIVTDSGTIELGLSRTTTDVGIVLGDARFENNLASAMTLANTSRGSNTTTYLRSSVSGNTTTGNFDMNGRFSGVFANNSLNLTGGSSTLHSFGNSTVSSNYFGTTSITNAVAGGNALATTTLSDNIFNNTLTIEATFAGSGTGNAMDDSVMNGNVVLGLTTFTASGPNADTLEGSSVVGNRFASNVIFESTNSTAGNALNRSVVSDNVFESSLLVYNSLDSSIIADNQINDTLNVLTTERATMVDSQVSGNNIINAFDITRTDTSGGSLDMLLSSIVANNSIGALSTWEQNGTSGGTIAQDSVISNNYFEGSWAVYSKGTNPTFDSTVIEGNRFQAAVTMQVGSAATTTTVTDVLSKCSFADNVILGNWNLGSSFILNTTQRATIDTAIIGNFIGGGFTVMNSSNTNGSNSEGFNQTTMVGNTIVNSWTVYGGVQDCAISANRYESSVNWGNVRGCTITGNNFEGDVDWIALSGTTDGVSMENCRVVGNYFGSLDIGSDASTKSSGNVDVIDVVFTNNYVDGTLFIVSDGTGSITAGDLFQRCNFSDNYIAGTFGSPDQAIEVGYFDNTGTDNVIFSNNVLVAGSLRIKSNFSSGIISGNNLTDGNADIIVNGPINNSIITGNFLAGDMNLQGTITDSVISNNVINGTFFSISTAGTTSLVGNYAGANFDNFSITGHFEAIGEPAVEAVGSGTEHAVEGTSGTGSGSAGIRGISSASGAFGVHGSAASGIAVKAESTGSATALDVDVSGGTNRGTIITPNTSSAHLRLIPMNPPSLTGATGDIYFDGVDDAPYWNDNGTWRRFAEDFGTQTEAFYVSPLHLIGDGIGFDSNESIIQESTGTFVLPSSQLVVMPLILPETGTLLDVDITLWPGVGSGTLASAFLRRRGHNLIPTATTLDSDNTSVSGSQVLTLSGGGDSVSGNRLYWIEISSGSSNSVTIIGITYEVTTSTPWVRRF